MQTHDHSTDYNVNVLGTALSFVAFEDGTSRGLPIDIIRGYIFSFGSHDAHKAQLLITTNINGLYFRRTQGGVSTWESWQKVTSTPV